jgi:hypothetical protein
VITDLFLRELNQLEEALATKTRALFLTTFFLFMMFKFPFCFLLYPLDFWQNIHHGTHIPTGAVNEDALILKTGFEGATATIRQRVSIIKVQLKECKRLGAKTATLNKYCPRMGKVALYQALYCNENKDGPIHETHGQGPTLSKDLAKINRRTATHDDRQSVQQKRSTHIQNAIAVLPRIEIRRQLHIVRHNEARDDVPHFLVRERLGDANVRACYSAEIDTHKSLFC